MEAISSFIGTDVYLNGKVIGRIIDFIIDCKNKSIKGISCISNTGIIRSKFFVLREGILHLDRNGVVIDKSKIRFDKLNEEFSVISPANDMTYGGMGDIYFDPSTLLIKSVSIKRGFLDDLIYGREFLNIDEITMTEKGIVKID